MEKFDLVKNGKVIKTRVRYDVEINCNGHNETHADVTLIDRQERCDCGIYDSIYPSPIYNGRFQKLGPKTSIISDADCTVTYSTPIINLSVTECKAYLLKIVNYRHSIADDDSYDADAILEDHLAAIDALDVWLECSMYDPDANWPEIVF